MVKNDTTRGLGLEYQPAIAMQDASHHPTQHKS